jgi:hypothetical protein
MFSEKLKGVGLIEIERVPSHTDTIDPDYLKTSTVITDGCTTRAAEQI